MLERAAQKLRLDQLVIQQGRTQITKGSCLVYPLSIVGGFPYHIVIQLRIKKNY